MKAKKLTVAVLTATFVLSFGLSALAEGTQTPTNPIDKKIQLVQTAKAAKDKVEALKTEIQTIKNLHQKAVDLRKQVNTIHKEQLRPAMQEARKAKNYDAMLLSLNDLKVVQTDLENVKQLTVQNSSVWDKMRSLRTSKDFDGAMNALKQIEANVQAKIDAYNKALVDINKALTDLKTATPAQ